MTELRCEVVVIGAGPAGMAAATAAASAGAPTMLLDERPEPGGQIWRRDRRSAAPRASRRVAEALRRSGAEVHGRATVFDLQPGLVRALGPSGVFTVSAPSIVLATGSVERFLPFPGWTLPGVVGVGALQALVKEGLEVRDARVLVAGTGPLSLEVAAKLRQRGARVLGVLEQRPLRDALRFAVGLWRNPSKVLQALTLVPRLLPTPIRHSSYPLRAEGEGRLQRVVARVGSSTRVFEVDWFACSFGLVPQIAAARLAGCAVQGECVVVDEWQRTSVPGIYCAGEPTGIGGCERALCEGRVAGYAAAGAEDSARAQFAARDRWRHFGLRLEHCYAPSAALRTLADDRTLVCRCEDVPLGALSSLRGSRDAKLHTRAGMGPCQGRVCGPALRFLFGWDADRTRPPLVPVPCSALAATASKES